MAKQSTNNTIAAATLIVLAMAGVLLYFYFTSNTFRWYESYENNSEQPYDTDIVYTLLSQSPAFSGWKNVDDSLHTALPTDPTVKVDNYVYIGNSLYIDSLDTERLIDFAEAGNTVFLSIDDPHNFFMDSLFKSLSNYPFAGSVFLESEEYENYLDEPVVFDETQPAIDTVNYEEKDQYDTLVTELGDTIVYPADSVLTVEEIEEQDTLYHEEWEEEDEFLLDEPVDFDGAFISPYSYTTASSVSLSLQDSALSEFFLPICKQYKKDTVPHSWAFFTDEWFSQIRDVNILGYMDESVNFISWKQGKGTIYVHTTPLAFTNLRMISDDNMSYSRQVLSVLGDGKTFWDEENRKYHKEAYKKTNDNQNPESNKGALEFILSEPQLRTAWYLLLLAVFLYFLFGSKRTQRIIPVKEKKENSTIEYTEVISQLFMRQKDHYSLIKLKSDLFKTNLRERYGIRWPEQSEVNSADFPIFLQQKTGVDHQLLKKIIERIHFFQTVEEANTEQMLDLHQLFEAFYEKAR